MINLLRILVKNRSIIWMLAKNDIKSRYLGSILGVLWVFLLPLINLFVVWFAFAFGFKAGVQHGVPYILWLITGMFPWIFCSDAISNATNSIVEKPYLVKKVVFDVELLPLVKIMASFILFIFLLSVTIIVFLAHEIYPTIYWLQLFYYIICAIFLVSSLSWITSSVVIFYKDFGQLISVVLQIGFWATPIFWSPSQLPTKFSYIIFLNPFTYIVSGYRDTFILKKWFWEHPFETLYFWTFTLLLSEIGLRIFRKLRPHFSDVL